MEGGLHPKIGSLSSHFLTFHSHHTMTGYPITTHELIVLSDSDDSDVEFTGETQHVTQRTIKRKRATDESSGPRVVLGRSKDGTAVIVSRIDPPHPDTPAIPVLMPGTFKECWGEGERPLFKRLRRAREEGKAHRPTPTVEAELLRDYMKWMAGKGVDTIKAEGWGAYLSKARESIAATLTQ